MTAEQNKAAVISILDKVFCKGNTTCLTELQDPNYVFHMVAGADVKGPQAFGEYALMMRKAFPDLTARVDMIVAEGDLVAHRATLTGTHKGELMGIPATGKTIKITATNWSRFKEGKEIEAWQDYDPGAMYKQLGISPLAG